MDLLILNVMAPGATAAGVEAVLINRGWDALAVDGLGETLVITFSRIDIDTPADAEDVRVDVRDTLHARWPTAEVDVAGWQEGAS